MNEISETARPALDPAAAADLIDGRSDRDAFGDEQLIAALAASGLVAIYGASDDLIELCGAIRDEADAYQGIVGFRNDGVIHFETGPHGPRVAGRIGINLDDAKRAEAERLDEEDHEHVIPSGSPTVEAAFGALAMAGDPDGPAWTFETVIPHETFITTLHGKPFSRGIVMRLADMLPDDQKEETR